MTGYLAASWRRMYLTGHFVRDVKYNQTSIYTVDASGWFHELTRGFLPKSASNRVLGRRRH